MAQDTTTETPFHAMDDNGRPVVVDLDAAAADRGNDDDLDDFFDTTLSPTTSGTHRYNLSSERFIFDGEDEDVLIIPSSSLANPYSGGSVSGQQPQQPLLLPGQHISGGLRIQHSHSLDDDFMEDDEFSADHPLAFPFSTPQNQSHRGRRGHHFRPELSGLNYLNACIFGIYLTISILFGSGAVQWLPSPWTVTTLPDYETLLTPSQWAGDYLWIPVLALEGLFVFAQLFPSVRSRPEVVDGVGYFFFYVALLQSLTTISFCLKWIIPAWFLLAMNSVCLLRLHLKLKQQLTTTTTTTTIYTDWKFWIFAFPFDLHLGWLLPLLASRASMCFRHYGKHDLGLQLGADIVAMALLLPCAGAYLLRGISNDIGGSGANRFYYSNGSGAGPQDWIVPLLILWAYIGIACRLSINIPPTLLEVYGKAIVEAVRGAAWCFAGTVSLFIVPRIVIWVAREFLTIRVVQLNGTDDENDGEEGDDDLLEDLIIEDPRQAAVVGMSQF